MPELTKQLESLKAAVEKSNDALSKASDQYLAESKKLGEANAETTEKVDKLLAQHNDNMKKLNELEVKLGEAEAAFASVTPQRSASPISAGELVAKAENTGDFARRVLANERSRTSIAVPRAALTNVNVGEGVVPDHRLPGIMPTLKQRLFLRDLITPGRTDSNMIHWVQQTGFTNNAKSVPEGELKPYSKIEFATKDTPVATIAHLFKASKQIMDDLPQLQSLIDSELRYGLKYAEEQQLLFGDGTSGNLHGIFPQASEYEKTALTEKVNGIDDIRAAIVQAHLARIPATGIVMHLRDWARIELLKDANGNYIFGNPSALAYPSLWGLPIVETEIEAFEGKFLTGAFSGAAQIFDREDANVVISTENEDDFARNLITVRCEERLALAVYRPEGFIKGEFTVAG